MVEEIVMADKREHGEQQTGDKRLQRRDERGRFSESDHPDQSLSQDARRHEEDEAPKGRHDRGDRKSH